MEDEAAAIADTEAVLVIGQSGIEGGEGSLAAQVASWIGTGQNLQVTADQISEALGPEKLAEFAEATGTSEQVVASTLAERLPTLIDELTPNGQMVADVEIESVGEGILLTSDTVGVEIAGTSTITVTDVTQGLLGNFVVKVHVNGLIATGIVTHH